MNVCVGKVEVIRYPQLIQLIVLYIFGFMDQDCNYMQQAVLEYASARQDGEALKLNDKFLCHFHQEIAF